MVGAFGACMSDNLPEAILRLSRRSNEGTDRFACCRRLTVEDELL